MRIVLTIIAFLFLAFSARSQVLKSAGVWYFLDVDSMTARPAVLPNGTELAYIIGTKTVYYWNRNTSTWTAYGSTFNRDSIYFDSSIIGSGTLSDPWRVDSTLFATITAVGDSIAAALSYVSANYFPLQGGTLTGTGGAGFIGFPSQVTAPVTPASGLNVYAQGSSFNWKGTDGYERQFGSTLTGGRTYTLPDVSGTFALGTGTTNRVPLWTSSSVLGNSNIQDNNTAVSILNSKPFALGQWTTAGRPTGVNGYVGYNTSFNWLDIYSSTGWFSPLQSSLTGGVGTATRVLFNDANGRATDNAGFRYINPGSYGALIVQSTNSPQVLISPTSGVSSMTLASIATNNDFSTSTTIGDGVYRIESASARHMFSFAGTTRYILSQNGITHTSSGTNGISITMPSGIFTVASNNFIYSSTSFTPFQIRSVNTPYVQFQNGTTANLEIGVSGSGGVFFPDAAAEDAAIRIANSAKVLRIGFGTGSTNSLFRLTSTSLGLGDNPSRTLHVNGEVRITDLTTDTPTRIVGADADGDLGAITVSTGLSLSGGVLTATSTADGNGIYTGSGTLSQHTTRALIPSTGNLFFSQKFNANADSAFFNIVNYLSGERAVNFGITDTSSTGYSRGYFESDGAGSMNWTLETNDANGSTTVRALEGALSLSTTAGNISISAPVDQEVIATGLVRAKQEAYYEINSTSSPQNLSNTYSDNFINQGGTQATFTLVFPASPEDGQILKITYNNNISALTLDGNGNTIVGTTVTTAVEGTQRVFKFYAGEGVWIRQN